MVQGIGVDIEEIARFKESYKDEHFINLVFTPREIAYCQKKKEPYISFAGKFCAKEAVIKASSKPLSVKQIEIINEKDGQPTVFINGIKEPFISCSISHTKDNAIAFVIMK